MDTINLLGTSLGLGLLSGISLYLTVFTVGLCLDYGWITLHPGLEPLQVLSDPWIWGIAGTLYAVEFFADKTPWLDSVWDSFHTLIRPVGAIMLASATLGQSHPALEILGALLAGSLALSSHVTKAGARLVINTSPEPFSNIAASVAEDTVVVFGSMVALQHPEWTIVGVILFVALFCWLAPILLRLIRAHALFLWGKVATSVHGQQADRLPNLLPHELDILLQKHQGSTTPVVWAIPCISGRFPGVEANLSGYLIGYGDRATVSFVAKGVFTSCVIPCKLHEARIESRTHWLFDQITLYTPSKGVLGQWRFLKSHAAWTNLAAEWFGGSFEEHFSRETSERTNSGNLAAQA